MSKRFQRPIALLLLLVGMCFAEAATPQKPVRESRIHVDGGIVPGSIEELWKQSDLIVHGVVERAETAPDRSTPSTRFVIRLFEVLKAGPRGALPGQVILLDMIGGDVDHGDYIERFEDHNSPLLRENQRPLLFLRWSESQQAYHLATGTPDSIYFLAGEALETHGKSALSRHIKGYSYGQLKAKLQTFRGVK